MGRSRKQNGRDETEAVIDTPDELTLEESDGHGCWREISEERRRDDDGI